MNTTIRPAIASDAEQIAQLWQQLIHLHLPYDRHFQIKDNAAAGFADHIRQAVQDSSSIILVAEHDNTLVGFIHGSILKRPPCFVVSHQGQIWDLFVSQEYRHQGVGRKLAQQALLGFREKQIEYVDIRVASANASALAFWREMGMQAYITVGKIEP